MKNYYLAIVFCLAIIFVWVVPPSSGVEVDASSGAVMSASAGIHPSVPDGVVWAEITAYNTIRGQCSGNPCESASGDNICGRKDVAACPAKYPFGTRIEIEGKEYVCLDRMHPRFGDRFDLSLDKDLEGARNWGVRYLKVKIIKNGYSSKVN